MSNIIKKSNTTTNMFHVKGRLSSKTPYNNIKTHEQLTQTNNQNKIYANKMRQYHPKTKQYCCLYHYLQGKQTKGLSPCNNHVSLGVINPITTLTKQQIQIIKNANILQIRNKQKRDTATIFVSADPCEFNYHTHFINEIDRRGSLPKELIKPRVYVQKVYSQQDDRRYDNFLYPKLENKVEYKQIYRLFKMFAEKTQFRDEKTLREDIMKFAKSNNIKTGVLNVMDVNINLDKTTVSQYLFSKQEFLSYLMSRKLGLEQSQKFWQAAYNRDRFVVAQRTEASLSAIRNEFVSMKAFVYNFKKFYLQQEEYYKNMFSEAGLRQRLIDLRLILQPWYNKNIILKYKLKKWKKSEFQLAQYLKDIGYKEESQILIKLIQQRNRLYTMMRTLAKSVYDLTDKKNMGMDVWGDRVTYIIQDKSDSLICFMQFVESFKAEISEDQRQVSNGNQQQTQQQQQQQQSKQSIQLTQLLEHLNNIKTQYSQLQQQWIITWIRNIYKYLYFYKDHEQLYFDEKSLKIVCRGSIFIEKGLISEFIRFKSNETDNFIEVLQNVTQQIEEKLSQRMPQLQGKKQYLVQCNYLAQTLLRIMRKNDFRPFQILVNINRIIEEHWFDYENCCQDIIDLLKSSQLHEQQLVITPNNEKFFKQLFILQQDKVKALTQTQNEPTNNNAYTYVDALDKYENIKQALGIQKLTINQINNVSKAAKSLKIQQQASQKNPKRAEQLLSKVQRMKQQDASKVEMEQQYHIHELCRQGYCSLCEDVISTEMSSTISKVQNMADYLTDLLRDIN